MDGDAKMSNCIYTTDSVLEWLEGLGYPDWVRTKCVERSLVSAVVDHKPGAQHTILREANRMWDEWRTEVFEADLSEAKGDKCAKSRAAAAEAKLKKIAAVIRGCDKLGEKDYSVAARLIKAAMNGEK
jgi:hypothetical protein